MQDLNRKENLALHMTKDFCRLDIIVFAVKKKKKKTTTLVNGCVVQWHHSYVNNLSVIVTHLQKHAYSSSQLALPVLRPVVLLLAPSMTSGTPLRNNNLFQDTENMHMCTENKEHRRKQ